MKIINFHKYFGLGNHQRALQTLFFNERLYRLISYKHIAHIILDGSKQPIQGYINIQSAIIGYITCAFYMTMAHK